jgi:prolyl-tRNA synthetase
MEYLKKVAEESGKNMTKQADNLFEGRIKDVKTKEELKKAIEAGFIARANFCSVEMDGAKCAEVVEKEIGATVRGTRLEKEKPSGKCIICGKPAKAVVYIAKQY